MKSPRLKNKDKKNEDKKNDKNKKLRQQLNACQGDVDRFRKGEELMRQTSENCEEALHSTDEKRYKRYISANSKEYNRLQKKQENKNNKNIKNIKNKKEYEPEGCKQCKRDLQHYKNVSVVNELFIYRISKAFEEIDSERYKSFVKGDKKREKRDIRDIEKGIDAKTIFARYGLAL